MVTFCLFGPFLSTKRYFISQDHPQNTRGILEYLQKHLKCRPNHNGVTYGCTKPNFRDFFDWKMPFFRIWTPCWGYKSVMNVQNHLKLKVQILTLLKYFTPPPLCIFEPRNSHFSLIWFLKGNFLAVFDPLWWGFKFDKNFFAEIERSHQFAFNEVQIIFWKAF